MLNAMSVEERGKKPGILLITILLITGHTGSMEPEIQMEEFATSCSRYCAEFATGQTSHTPMDERLAQLEEATQTYEDNKKISSPKIQRVPTFLRQNAELAKYYSPMMISFGPIHHGSENLKLGEHFKLLWTFKFVEEYSIRNYLELIEKSKEKLAHPDTNEGSKILHEKITLIIWELERLLEHEDTTEKKEFLRKQIPTNIEKLKELLTHQHTKELYLLLLQEDKWSPAGKTKNLNNKKCGKSMNMCANFLSYLLLETICLPLTEDISPDTKIMDQFWHLIEKLKELLTYQHNNEGGKFFHTTIKENIEFLHGKIENNIKELKDQFTEDAIRINNDKDLAWMLFVDGCSLLYLMKYIDDDHPEALMLKHDQLLFMFRDILLLENQLPRNVLEMLGKESRVDLDELMLNYEHMGGNKGCKVLYTDNPKPIHVLDHFRSKYLSTYKMMDVETGQVCYSGKDVEDQQDRGKETVHLFKWQTYKNIRDLKTAGVQVMPNDDVEGKYRWSNISFTPTWFGGELRLPLFLFNDVTPYFFHNLIAYERCPDFNTQYECCSFFSFMDSLIDSAEDVKELRSAGVIQNLFGSDEELAEFFNHLGNDLPTKMSSNYWSNEAVGYSRKYIEVRIQIEEHYRNKWKTWLAVGYNTYFNTPWAMIGFLAAFLALLLTFVQTWYAIHPKN